MRTNKTEKFVNNQNKTLKCITAKSLTLKNPNPHIAHPHTQFSIVCLSDLRYIYIPTKAGINGFICSPFLSLSHSVPLVECLVFVHLQQNEKKSSHREKQCVGHVGRYQFFLDSITFNGKNIHINWLARSAPNMQITNKL